MVAQNYIPSVIYQSSCSPSLLTLGITKLLDFSPSDNYKMVSVIFVVLIGISLLAGVVGNLCLLVFRGFSFINCLYPLLIFPLGCCLFHIDLHFLLFWDTYPFLLENELQVCRCGCSFCWSGDDRGLVGDGEEE